jgi:hypothetical protein
MSLKELHNMTIDQMARTLHSVGACFAVSSAKTILPNDGFDAKPAYHIHPDSSNPRQDAIERVYSQPQLQDWVRTTKASKRLTNPDDAWELWIEYQNRWS